MSVIGIVVGAIGGALGGAAGWGIASLIWPDREPADRPRWPAIVCVALALAISRPITHELTAPSVESELAQAEKQLPALAAMRETSPSEYADVQAAAKRLQAGEIGQSEAMQLTHAALAKAVGRKTPTAPDSLVQAQAQLAGAEYQALQGTPEICVNYIAGTSAVDLRQYLPPNMIASDQDIMSRLLRAQPISNPHVATEVEVQKAVEPMIQRMIRNEHVTGEQVDQALQVKGDPALTCKVFASLMTQISQLPTEQAAAVTRGLAKMGQE